MFFLLRQSEIDDIGLMLRPHDLQSGHRPDLIRLQESPAFLSNILLK